MASMRRAISTGETRRRPTSYLGPWVSGLSAAAPSKAWLRVRCWAALSGRDVVLASGQAEGAVQCATARVPTALRVFGACGHAAREVQRPEPGEAQAWRAPVEPVGWALRRDELPLTSRELGYRSILSCRPERARLGPAQSGAPLQPAPNVRPSDDRHVAAASALDGHLRGTGARLTGAWRLCAGARRWAARRCREPRTAPRLRRRWYRRRDRRRVVAPTARPADPARREIRVRARPSRSAVVANGRMTPCRRERTRRPIARPA